MPEAQAQKFGASTATKRPQTHLTLSLLRVLLAYLSVEARFSHRGQTKFLMRFASCSAMPMQVP